MAGAHKRNFEFGHQQRSIESMEFNSNFSSEDFEDDISIITVTEAFDFSDPHVQPIDMFKTDDAKIPDGTTCVSTGKFDIGLQNFFRKCKKTQYVHCNRLDGQKLQFYPGRR